MRMPGESGCAPTQANRAGGLLGHLSALSSAFFWGITFISTKILLRDLGPIEILYYRFLLAWLALWVICPKWLSFDCGRQEGLFALAGLCGVTLYFLLENIALMWTMASNVSVIVSISPFFTSLLAWKIMGDAKPGINFYLGFLLAMAGICLISFNGRQFQINPAGDILAFLAAITWAFYSIITRKLALAGYGSLLTTRRIFFYGMLFITPLMALTPIKADFWTCLALQNLGNLLFLGLGASALCFVAWTFALSRIGATSASIYIYLVPVISIICAGMVLHEPMTPLAIAGCFLTVAGLLVSESRFLRMLLRGGCYLTGAIFK